MSSDMLAVINSDCLNALKTLPDKSVQCCVTSPPYWGLRDYGNPNQIGLELTFEEYIAKLVEVFGEVRRVLKDDGTLWLNLGDSYSAGPSAGPSAGFTPQNVPAKGGQENSRRAGGCHLPAKNLIGIPWRVAFALQTDGWILRNEIIWAKKCPMPESVSDRCTKSHEHIFLLAKSQSYFYDAEAIKEPAITYGSERPRDKSTEGYGEIYGGILPPTQKGERLWTSETRNKRDVWTCASEPYAEAHFATFPPTLILPCILAGSRAGDMVLDPFFGSGTTGKVALELGRRCIGIELNADYIALARQRCETTIGLPL